LTIDKHEITVNIVFVKGDAMETMKRNLWLLVMVIFAVSLVSLNACSRRAAKKDRGGETLEEEAMKPMGEEGISEQELEEARRKVAELRQKEGAVLATVYFEFDDFSLSPQAKAILAQNAAWLMNNSQRDVIIEGHCDERGMDEYNIALGERRANAAKRYLISLGVNASQLSTISFGEERPAVQGHTEEVWVKNRRAEFVVQ
jgi:peptidoglycan-associated lipoprotein